MLTLKALVSKLANASILGRIRETLKWEDFFFYFFFLLPNDMTVFCQQIELLSFVCARVNKIYCVLLRAFHYSSDSWWNVIQSGARYTETLSRRCTMAHRRTSRGPQSPRFGQVRKSCQRLWRWKFSSGDWCGIITARPVLSSIVIYTLLSLQ